MRVGDISVNSTTTSKPDTVTKTNLSNTTQENLNTNDLSEQQGGLKLNNEEKALAEAVEHANKAIEGSGRYFKYEMYEPTNRVVISVIDNKTDEVIKEIPSTKLLDVVSKLMELAGLLVDERR